MSYCCALLLLCQCQCPSILIEVTVLGLRCPITYSTAGFLSFQISHVTFWSGSLSFHLSHHYSLEYLLITPVFPLQLHCVALHCPNCSTTTRSCCSVSSQVSYICLLVLVRFTPCVSLPLTWWLGIVSLLFVCLIEFHRCSTDTHRVFLHYLRFPLPLT